MDQGVQYHLVGLIYGMARILDKQCHQSTVRTTISEGPGPPSYSAISLAEFIEKKSLAAATAYGFICR